MPACLRASVHSRVRADSSLPCTAHRSVCLSAEGGKRKPDRRQGLPNGTDRGKHLLCRKVPLLLRVHSLDDHCIERLGRGRAGARWGKLPAEVAALAALADQDGPRVSREPRVLSLPERHLEDTQLGEIDAPQRQDLEGKLQLREAPRLLEVVERDVQARDPALLHALEGVALHAEARHHVGRRELQVLRGAGAGPRREGRAAAPATGRLLPALGAGLTRQPLLVRIPWRQNGRSLAATGRRHRGAQQQGSEREGKRGHLPGGGRCG
mmetsp:Transcript_47075/g.140503  ORF Transcript_47075/g.140503 Transcript_47075/m.140503 type:complete len:267 (+) Transcript_47075:2-802(+)